MKKWTAVNRSGQALSTYEVIKYMNVTSLLKILRNYVGTDRHNALDYCAYIFSLLMKEPESAEDIRLDENESYYPFTSPTRKSSAQKLMSGDRGIPNDIAKMVYSHFDKSKLLEIIEALAYDTKRNLCIDLSNKGIDCNNDNVSEVCAELFNTYIREAIDEVQPDNYGVIEKRNEIGEVIPPVPIVAVRYHNGKIYTGDSIIELSPYLEPAEEESDELPYIDALMEVYSEKEKRSISRENITTLKTFLRKHYSDQKRAYVGAYGLQRRIREVFSDGEEQFATLENDTCECIEPVYYNDSYNSGFDRLQAVLAQVVGNPSRKSALYNISGLIGALEQKGICHILVNDKKIKSWVDMYDESI